MHQEVYPKKGSPPPPKAAPLFCCVRQEATASSTVRHGHPSMMAAPWSSNIWMRPYSEPSKAADGKGTLTDSAWKCPVDWGTELRKCFWACAWDTPRPSTKHPGVRGRHLEGKRFSAVYELATRRGDFEGDWLLWAEWWWGAESGWVMGLLWIQWWALLHRMPS